MLVGLVMGILRIFDKAGQQVSEIFWRNLLASLASYAMTLWWN